MAKPLTEIVANSPAFAEELGKLRAGNTRMNPLVFDRACPASYAFIAALVAAQSKHARRVWVICEALPQQERMAAELPLWREAPAIFIPEQEIHINQGLSDPELAAERLDALRRISTACHDTQVVITTARGLEQIAPSFEQSSEASLTLRCGEEHPLGALCAHLSKQDFERVEQVTARGQWSLRGGIMDIFPLQTAWPLRVEFFGDEVESIRAFDVDSQLSFKKLTSIELLLDEPPADKPLKQWISPQDWVISCPGSGFAGDVLLFETPADLYDTSHLPEELDELTRADALAFFASPLGNFETGDFVMQEARREAARLQLLQWKRDKWRVLMYFPHAGEKKRFEEICGEDEAWSGVQHRDGDLPFGFSLPGAQLAVLSAAEIFGRYTSPHARRLADREDRLRRERAQAPLREIEEGNLVIHASHGLGRFVGVVAHEETGEEELHIQYAGGVLLRIPLAQSHLVSK